MHSNWKEVKRKNKKACTNGQKFPRKSYRLFWVNFLKLPVSYHSLELYKVKVVTGPLLSNIPGSPLGGVRPDVNAAINFLVAQSHSFCKTNIQYVVLAPCTLSLNLCPWKFFSSCNFLGVTQRLLRLHINFYRFRVSVRRLYIYLRFDQLIVINL